MTLFLAWLLALSANAAEINDPFASRAEFWKERGFSVRERISRTDGPYTAGVIVYAGAAGDRLEVYVLYKGRDIAAYSHPSGSDRLELDPSPAGRFSDLFGDGSRAVAYYSRASGLGSALHVLRWRNAKISRAAKFPGGRVERVGATAVFSSRTQPLGRYFSAGCDDMGAVSRTIVKTALYVPRGKSFTRVDAEHPEFFEREIAHKEKKLAALPGGFEKSTGDFIGLAVSIYYDQAAVGRKKEGWEQLRARLAPPGYAPRSVKNCLRSLEKELQQKLGA